MILLHNSTCIHKAFTDIQNKRKIYLGKGKETLNFFAKKLAKNKYQLILHHLPDKG